MKKSISFILTFILLSVFSVYSQNNSDSDSVKNAKMKTNLVKFYNKFLAFQKTDEYKSIIKMTNAPAQDQKMRSKVDSIAKTTGFKNAGDFYNSEELMRREPTIKQYSDRIANNAKKIEADTTKPVVIDSNLVKSTTKNLVDFYSKLEKWSTTPEFKSFKDLKDRKKIQDTIRFKENQIAKEICNLPAAKLVVLEMKYKINDKQIQELKKKYKTAQIEILPKPEKKDMPKPDSKPAVTPDKSVNKIPAKNPCTKTTIVPDKPAKKEPAKSPATIKTK